MVNSCALGWSNQGGLLEPVGGVTLYYPSRPREGTPGLKFWPAVDVRKFFRSETVSTGGSVFLRISAASNYVNTRTDSTRTFVIRKYYFVPVANYPRSSVPTD